MRHGVSSCGRRRVRLHGCGAAAAPRGAPRARGRRGHGRLERGGHVVGELYPSLAAAYATSRTRRSTAAASPGSTSCSWRCRTGESQTVVADAGGRGRSRRRPRRRLPAPADALREVVRRASTPHPTLLDRFAFGLPELYRDEIGAARHVAAPGCYPTTASLALAPLLADGLVEPTGIVVDAVSGVSGAGRGLKAASLFAEVDENVAGYGLLHHRHTGRDGDGARARRGRAGAGAVHAPPRADDARHPRHVLRAPGGDGSPRPSCSAVPGVLRRRAVRGRERRLARRRRRRSARTPRTSPCATTRAPNTVLAIGALDNLVKGASGQAIQSANLLLGLPETIGLPTRD